MRLSTTIPLVRPVAPAKSPAQGWGSARILGLAGLLLAGLAGALALGAFPRVHQAQVLQAAAAEEAAAPPTVNVVQPRRAEAQAERVLPGNAQPYLQADIYARTNGYLKRRLVDIGDRVQAGQLLAEIDAPDVDAQLLQAQAAVVQAQANLARAQADQVYANQEEIRYRKLVGSNSVTLEEYQNKLMLLKVSTANVSAMQATIEVDRADVQRLTTLHSFQKLTAPFAGVITVRNIDPGALITADNPSSERLLFRIAATDPLRVFVDVPQVFSTAVKPGQKAIVFRREEPGREFVGQVTRTADALDDNTRTLRTEVQVPNADGALRPGMYLQVKLLLGQEAAPLLIPTAAIVTRSSGPTVAVLEQGKVHYRPVQLGRDYGANIEVLSGLTGDEQVIVHPGDDLPEGSAATPIQRPAKTEPPSPG